MDKVALFGRVALAGLASSGGVAAVAAPPEPGFYLPGLAPGAKYGWVTSLSSDGMVAGGFSAEIGPIFAAGFTWNKAGGRSDFGLLPGMPPYTPAYGVSDNGVVAGVMDTVSIPPRAYRWTGSGALQDLGLLPGEERSYAWGVSGDGAVVVGHAEYGTWTYYTGQAFRWTAAKGMQGLGYAKAGDFLSDARAVSRDGKTIVGISGPLGTDAFVWTEQDGMKPLPMLPGSLGDASAEGVTVDGLVIVGASTAPDTTTHIVRWKGGAVEDLSAGLPLADSYALAVSDDGEVIAGSYNAGGPINTALLWTAAAGAMDLSKHLASVGIQVPSGYKLEYAYAISGDGLTFGGQARNLATGLREGFVATVPAAGACKPDCDASGELNIDDFICFQTRFAISDPYADCDGSGSLDIDDFVCFQTAYAIGC